MCGVCAVLGSSCCVDGYRRVYIYIGMCTYVYVTVVRYMFLEKHQLVTVNNVGREPSSACQT